MSMFYLAPYRVRLISLGKSINTSLSLCRKTLSTSSNSLHSSHLFNNGCKFKLNKTFFTIPYSLSQWICRRYSSTGSGRKLNLEKILPNGKVKMQDRCVYHVDNLTDYLLLNIGVAVFSGAAVVASYVGMFGVDLTKNCPDFINIWDIQSNERTGRVEEGCQPGMTFMRYQLAETRHWSFPAVLLATVGAGVGALVMSRRTVNTITLLGDGATARLLTNGLTGRPVTREYPLKDLYMPHPSQLRENYKKHLYVRGHRLPLMVEANAPLMDTYRMEATLGQRKDFMDEKPRDYYDLN